MSSCSNEYVYAKPNPHYNSIRCGLLTNIPPDNGNPDKPHTYDKTCLCDDCNEERMDQTKRD